MKPQMQLFNYSFFNKEDDSSADIYIDGYIVDSPTQEIMREYWGDQTSVSFKSMRNQVEKANPKKLNIIVNSGGGHVGDAMAIHDYLNELEKKGVVVNRKGMGIVASAATYLVMGNNSEVTENTMFMIHNVQMMAYGDIVQVENQVKAGRKFNDMIRDFYANKTGKPAETIAAWMNKETWFTGKEAKENGFVSNVSESVSFKNSITPDKWPFTNTSILNHYNSFIKTDSTMDIKKVTDAINNQFAALLEKLGLKDKAGDDNVKNVFADFSANITNAIKEASTPAKPGEPVDIANTVQDAVTNAIAALKLDETIGNKITEATKNLATAEDLKKLEGDVTEKLGNRKGGEEKELEPGERKVTNKQSFFNVGSFEKSAN